MNANPPTHFVGRLHGQLILMLTASIAINLVLAAEKSDSSVRLRQFAQQQARASATELVSNILDIQLRQFKENKLEKLPAYGDIEAMRRNLDQLVEKEMQSVVQLLVKAEESSDAERQAAVTQARTQGRAVVVALLAEQQRLHQRMRLAKIAAQARQLIDLETQVLLETGQLPEKPPAEREESTLEQLEDQRDVGVLHAQLMNTLREVMKWESATGAAAKKGLSLLTSMQVDQELKKAADALNANRFMEAEKSEEAAIKGWKALLEVIEEAQGLNDSNLDSASKALDAIAQQQSQLRDETKAAKLEDESQSEKLAEQQHEVQEQLNDLAEKLPMSSSFEGMAKKAAESATQAETSIFEAKQESALQQQQQVLDALAEMSKKLAEEAQAGTESKSDPSTEKTQPAEKSDQSPDSDAAKKPDFAPDSKSELTQKSKQPSQKASRKEPGDDPQQTEQEGGIPTAASKSAQGRNQSDGGAASASQSLEAEPWFAKLPPDVQKSIQARSRRPAPRGYEERLKRYFESD